MHTPARPRRTPLLIGAVLVLVLIVVPSTIQLSTDWYWFREIGYTVVFRTELLTKLALFVGVWAVAFAFLYGNLRLGQRGLVPDPVVVRLSPAAPHIDLTGILRRLSFPVSAALAFLIAVSTTAVWLDLLLYARQVPFGYSDPIFGRDVAFYIFTLPVLTTALGVLLALLLLALLMAVPIYWLRGDIIVAPRHVRVEPSAQMHLGILLALFFLFTGLQIWLVRVPSTLLTPSEALFGAGHTDLAIRLPALRLQAIVAILAAAFIALGAFRRKVVWHSALAAPVYIVVAFLGGAVVPALFQRLVVAPNELTREIPQLTHHIDATRRAWGLADVITRDLTGEARLTLDDLAENSATIENVRLWDRDPLLQTFGQLQEIRTYYDFVNVDDDRYWIDGRYRQVLLSPRELNSASLPTRTFINEHLTFTHGMGITLSPVNQVTPEGLPVLFIRDLPPVSSVDLSVSRPQIYFGELTDNFVAVNTGQREFDYPSGEANVFTAYEGTGGVPVNTVLRRALLAVRFGSLKFFLSDDITSESRVLYRRSIGERARTALPFVSFDGDPYLVVDGDGGLQWIMDAYTTSNRFPYARPLRGGTNYMRNSVKVVIDAYHGTVTAYISDPRDPIVQALARVFPGILQPLDQMPESLRGHLRYPEDLYRAQTELYRVYHMDEAEQFYHREDEWQIPQLDRAGERASPFMRRIIMRLPDQEQAEFIFMTPYTPRQRDNLAAWIVARNDGENYGQLVVYRFSKQSLVYGPRQVVNRINQDTEISRQFALWDQRGSQVIRGELLVIPIEEALLYVQPIYLRAEGGRIPELKRVVVAYQNRVVMEETLDRALAVLFGVAPPSPVVDDALTVPVEGLPSPPVAAPAPAPDPAMSLPADAAALGRRAMQHYERAVQAQRAGDWSTYGQEIERLGAVLRQMSAAAAASPPVTPPTPPPASSPPASSPPR